jgi:hypothetical protein
MAGVTTSTSAASARPAPGLPRHQRLRHDPLEHEGELRAHLRLLRGREHVDDARDRLGRRVGVQRRERQVARLGDGQRGLDGLQVAHLAHQQHVGVLAERVLERAREALRVGADLALVDDAPLVAVHELDRVLDRDDVAAALAVDLVEHRRERGALARPRGPGDEHEPARLLGHLRHHRRQPELAERLDHERHLPHGQRHAAALLERVAAEAGELRDAEREVELVLLLEALLLRVGERRVGERHRVARARAPARARRSPGRRRA